MGHFQGSWRKKFQILCSETEARVGFAQNPDLNQLATALGQGQRSGGPNLSLPDKFIMNIAGGNVVVAALA